MSLRVLLQTGEGLGFRLAGAQVEELEPAALVPRLHALLEDPAVAVVAIDEQLWDTLPQTVAERVGKHGRVVVLPFALPHRWSETGGGQAYLAAVIRRAVGYHIKLGGVG